LAQGLGVTTSVQPSASDRHQEVSASKGFDLRVVTPRNPCRQTRNPCRQTRKHRQARKKLGRLSWSGKAHRRYLLRASEIGITSMRGSLKSLTAQRIILFLQSKWRSDVSCKLLQTTAAPALHADSIVVKLAVQRNSRTCMRQSPFRHLSSRNMVTM